MKVRRRTPRWVLAEELAHVLLEHRLVNGTAPGVRVVGLLEAQRLVQEREARVFPSELLMPFAEVSLMAGRRSGAAAGSGVRRDSQFKISGATVTEIVGVSS